MNESSLLIAAVALVGGLILGFLLTRGFYAPIKKRQQLGEELRETKQKQAIYERQVAEHFVKTSNLVNNLSENYRELHKHLVSSANTLANPDISQELINNSGLNHLEHKNQPVLASQTHEAPKDYAPSQGILDEEYGLNQAPPFNNEESAGNEHKPQSSGSNKNKPETSENESTVKTG